MVSEIGLRQAYSTIKSAYRSKQRNPVTTASDLRLVVPVSGTKTNYSFPVLVGDDPNNYTFATLLNRADAFTGTSIGLFCGVGSSATSTQFDWYSYGNATTFSNATSLKTLFNNSIINIAINNVQYLQNFSTSRFRKVPVTQTAQTYGYAAGTGSATPPNNGVQVSNTVDAFNGTEDGYYPLVPTLQLSGTSKIDIQLLLPEALTSLSNSYIMIAFRGFLSLGASNLNK